MDLGTWLKAEPGRSKLALARAAGVRWKTIHKTAQGRRPRVETALAIERATDGEVTVAELLQLPQSSEAA